MQQIARVGYVVNDLRRNWPAIWMTILLARSVTGNRTFRPDAPQSSRAAFTVRELRTLAHDARLRNCRINRHHEGFRMVLGPET